MSNNSLRELLAQMKSNVGSLQDFIKWLESELDRVDNEEQ